MEISLTMIVIMVVVFIFRVWILKKIKITNRCYEPSNNNYVAIPSKKVLNAICFILVLLCMALGLILFEFYYAAPNVTDEILWYIMLGCIGLSGLYYGLMLHTQYFYFTFGKDYIEFNLKIGKRSKDAVKIPLQEVENINKNTNRYCITLKNQNCHFISFRKIEGLIGSELLKKKLENFVT